MNMNVKQQLIQKETLDYCNSQKKKNSRFVNGLLIATKGKIFHVKDEKKYWVQSQRDSRHFYDVRITEEGGLSCNCMDSKKPNVVCKHQYSVIIHEVGK